MRGSGVGREVDRAQRMRKGTGASLLGGRTVLGAQRRRAGMDRSSVVGGGRGLGMDRALDGRWDGGDYVRRMGMDGSSRGIDGYVRRQGMDGSSRLGRAHAVTASAEGTAGRA